MTSSTSTPVTPDKASLRPAANTMPRRVSFGATPTPERLPDSRTASKKSSNTSLKASELHHKMKSISAVDKNQETRLVKLYTVKSKTGLAGMMNWLQDKVKSGGTTKK